MASRDITIQFGELINIPMKKESATLPKQSMSNLCAGQPGHDEHEPTPLKAPKVCESCGPIIDNTVLLKGVKQGRAYVVLNPEEIAAAKETYSAEYKGALSLVAHPVEQVATTTAPGDSLHYLTPASDKAAGQYRTLVEFIESHPELAFVGLHTPVSVTDLYQVTARNGVLVMEKRVRAQAMKPMPSVGGEPLKKLAAFLEMELEEAITDFAPDAYEDKYQIAVGQLMAAAERVVSEAVRTITSVSGGVSDADLMEKLARLEAVA